MPSQPHPRESLTSSQAASAFASFTAAFYAAFNGQAYCPPSNERVVVDLLAGARSLIGQDWTRPTGNGVLSSFDCSSGVVLMEVITARP